MTSIASIAFTILRVHLVMFYCTVACTTVDVMRKNPAHSYRRRLYDGLKLGASLGNSWPVTVTAIIDKTIDDLDKTISDLVNFDPVPYYPRDKEDGNKKE